MTLEQTRIIFWDKESQMYKLGDSCKITTPISCLDFQGKAIKEDLIEKELLVQLKNTIIISKIRAQYKESNPLFKFEKVFS